MIVYPKPQRPTVYPPNEGIDSEKKAKQRNQ